MREYKTLIIKGSVGKCKLGFWRVVGYFEKLRDFVLGGLRGDRAASLQISISMEADTRHMDEGSGTAVPPITLYAAPDSLV